MPTARTWCSIALHGRFGEDGAIQGVLDWIGIPYTHSGIRASAVAMDKHAARAVFVAAGLPVAAGGLVPVADLAGADPLPLPYVIKPVNEGSSVGVEIIRAGSNTRAAIAAAWSFGPNALVEEFIPGRELTVAVVGETRPHRDRHHPKPVDEPRLLRLRREICGRRLAAPAAGVHPSGSLRAGARDRARRPSRAGLQRRIAHRLPLRRHPKSGDTAPGRLVILEVNTQPGLTPTSLLPEQAAFCGMDFGALCAWMVEHAACRA